MKQLPTELEPKYWCVHAFPERFINADSCRGFRMIVFIEGSLYGGLVGFCIGAYFAFRLIKRREASRN